MIKLEADERYLQAAPTSSCYSSYCAEKKATGFQANMTNNIDDYDNDGENMLLEKYKNIRIKITTTRNVPTKEREEI